MAEESLWKRFKALAHEGEEELVVVTPQETTFSEDEEETDDNGVPLYLSTEARIWDHYIEQKKKKGEITVFSK